MRQLLENFCRIQRRPNEVFHTFTGSLYALCAHPLFLWRGAHQYDAHTGQVLDMMQLASCGGFGLLLYQHRAGHSLSTRAGGFPNGMVNR